MLVEFLKEGSLKKDDSVKTARLTKPAMVPIWTKTKILEQRREVERRLCCNSRNLKQMDS